MAPVRGGLPGETELNNDDLKKLGLRIRPRVVQPRAAQAPGQIAFDDRGNAVYEWNDDRLAEDSDDAERARRNALDHPGLSIMDEEPRQGVPIRNNAKGLRLGYNPYESGLLAKKERKRKTDLRELSKWVELKRRMEQEGSD